MSLSNKFAQSASSVNDLIIIARAGCGKTFTLVEGINRLAGRSTASITGSDQQDAIWQHIAAGPKTSSVLLVAFNKSIATELQEKVPSGVTCSTIHSLGFGAVRNAFRGIRAEFSYPVMLDHLEAIAGKDIKTLRRAEDNALVSACDKLCSLCKLTLTDPTPAGLQQLVDMYDIDTNGSFPAIADYVPQMLQRHLEGIKNGTQQKITPDDMIWLPVVCNLPIAQYDVVGCDECQDLNACQRSLVIRAGKRHIFVGDNLQAIYGFAGAECDSITQIQNDLEAAGRTVDTLPLTVTRRCSKLVVDEARKIVTDSGKPLIEDFSAYETNLPGEISNLELEVCEAAISRSYDESDKSRNDVMIVSRTNAPIVSLVFRLIKANVPAFIQGRDMVAGLLSIVKKSKAATVVEFLAYVQEYEDKETEKAMRSKYVNESKLIAIQDKCDCLRAFADGVSTVEEITSRIESVFADRKSGVRLSSIHRAKGLEAETVYLLNPSMIPHPMATGLFRQQEYHLKYVAVTRSKNRLIYVHDSDKTTGKTASRKAKATV